MGTSVKENLIAEIDKLSPDLQLRLLDITKSLTPKGIDGKTFLRFEGAISADDLDMMSRAIDEECEGIDIGEW